MKTVLVIARHGNTFRRGETPRRVGGASDLPLVEEERGRNIGLYLKDKGLIPSAVYAAPLLRTVRTAELAVEAMGCKTEVIQLREFTEIDYGPDENKTEEEIELRLGDGDRDKGRAVIEAWNKNAAVPDGWRVNPSQIIETWLDFAENTVLRNGRNKTTLIVTSNGVIRFAPYLTGDFEQFAREHEIKVSTGGICIFEKTDSDTFWKCTAWNGK